MSLSDLGSRRRSRRGPSIVSHHFCGSVSEGRNPLRGRAVCARRFRFVQRPRQALNIISRRQDSHTKNVGIRRTPGLPATVTGKPYELTADVIEPTQANFIARDDFLRFLREHGEAAAW